MKKILFALFSAAVIVSAMVFAIPAYAAYESQEAGVSTTVGFWGYIDVNGGLWLWGPNTNCSAGQEKCNWVDEPTLVMDHVVSFARDQMATIVLKDDGSVWTFGFDYSPDHLYGGHFSSHPEPVKRLDDCVAVSVGNYGNFAALSSDGSLYTWGDPTWGMLGVQEDTPGADKSIFEEGQGSIVRPYKLMTGVKSIAMGQFCGMAIKTDGSLWYWGLDEKGGVDVVLPTKLCDGVAQISNDEVGAIVMENGSLWRWRNESDYSLTTFERRRKIADDAVMVSGCYTKYGPEDSFSTFNLFVLKKDGSLYGMDGGEFIMNDVCYVYTAPNHGDGFRYRVALKNDGTLVMLKQTQKGLNSLVMYDEDRVIASNVMLPGQTPVKKGDGDLIERVGSFTDVLVVDWFADPVIWALDKGITSGTSETTFSPDKNCTAAEIITFLWRANGSPLSTVGNPFSDVSYGEWYAEAAIWAYEKGLVDGGVFNGGQDCTRIMAVTYMWKLAGSPKDTSHGYLFVDVGFDINQPVVWALDNGITQGVKKGYFAPGMTCTRGQIVTFLYRAYAGI